MKKVITFFALSLAIVAKGQDVLQLNELEYYPVHHLWIFAEENSRRVEAHDRHREDSHIVFHPPFIVGGGFRVGHFGLGHLAFG